MRPATRTQTPGKQASPTSFRHALAQGNSCGRVAVFRRKISSLKGMSYRTAMGCTFSRGKGAASFVRVNSQRPSGFWQAVRGIPGVVNTGSQTEHDLGFERSSCLAGLEATSSRIKCRRDAMTGRLENAGSATFSCVDSFVAWVMAGIAVPFRNSRCGNHNPSHPLFPLCFSTFFSYLVFLSDSFVFPLLV